MPFAKKSTLRNTKESDKKQDTFTVTCQTLKYEIHKNLWKLNLKVYSKLRFI